jgi:uncharacterized protein YxjI
METPMPRNLRERRHGFKIDLAPGADMETHGNILDREYEIRKDGHQVAEVSKKRLRVRDIYTVEVQPGQDDALILAIAVCLDQISAGS